MPPETAEVQMWLRKARNDWNVCRKILQSDPVETDVAAFHCQQAVEKTLKAYLVHAGTPFGKIHDLGHLLELCGQSDPLFSSLRDRVEPLTLFAVAFRYPGPPDPELQQVREALQVVADVWDFVLTRVPAEAHP
jgi:HEPN domain-containing protein